MADMWFWVREFDSSYDYIQTLLKELTAGAQSSLLFELFAQAQAVIALHSK